MKRTGLIVPLAAALLLLGAAHTGRGEDAAEEAARRAGIARQFVSLLGKMHVSKTLIDDAHSEKAWKNLVESYDEEHCYFFRKDIDAFEPMRRAIDDALLKRDISFGEEVYRVYAARARDCAIFATNELAKITADSGFEAELRRPTTGEYVFSGEGRGWPKTESERNELWRRKLRTELLERLVEAELDAEKSGGKKVSLAEIASALAEDYAQQVDALGEQDDLAAFERYMTSVGASYDPHTHYLSPALQKMFEGEMSLSFCGIGVTIDTRRTGLYVLAIMPDGPAARDGRLKPGDRIVGVGEGDGPIKSVKGVPGEKAIRMISGKKGTKVVLEVVTADGGGARTRIDLVRGIVKLEKNAAKGRLETVKPGGGTLKLGYVKLPLFYGMQAVSILDLFKSVRSATADVNEELKKLEQAGARGLVLDLRGNGGGSLLEALMLSSVFMDAGAVVQIQDDDDGDKPMELSGLPGIAGGGWYSRPMVVLIDRGSASASELVSGVLQDRGRAVILGDRQTHGKGSMQEVIQLGKRRGGALVTRGFFYRVTGSSTQVKGVASDIRLPSVLDGITKLGENNLPNALPWTKVAAVKYEKSGDVQRYVPELARRSAARQATNTVFQAHLEKVRGVAEACNRKSLPLDYAAFKAQKRRDLQCGVDKVGFNGLDVDVVPDADACDKNGLPKRGKDVVLDEALNILADLVELSGESGKGK